MKTFRPFPHPLMARALLPALLAGLALSLSLSLSLSLAGCDRSADSASPAKTSSSKATGAQMGLTLKGDGLTIEAATATAMLRGYSPQPLSVRIMSGWVNPIKPNAQAKRPTRPKSKNRPWPVSASSPSRLQQTKPSQVLIHGYRKRRKRPKKALQTPAP